jgi:signal peptidase I
VSPSTRVEVDPREEQGLSQEAAVDDDTGAAASTNGKGDAESSTRRKGRHWLALCLSAALIALALTWGGWLISGGRLFMVGSPSMGTVAPVGSLVATQPLATSDQLHKGEIVVFEPRPGHSLSYVHRIYEVLSGGRYLTKGDLNQAPDPWVITRGDVIGTPQAIIPAIGWVYTWATWLFFGAAILLTAARFLGRRHRRWVLALGPVVLFAVPLLKYRPLIGGFLYGSGKRGRLVTAKIIDTGILPVHFSPTLGHSVYAAPGQEVIVTGLAPNHSSTLDIRMSAALPWWGWMLVIVTCFVPLMLIAVDYWLRQPMRSAPDDSVGDEPLESPKVDTPVRLHPNPASLGSQNGF